MEIEELIDNFEFLDNWEDKYRYIIELGEKLPLLEAEYHTDEWKVQGCQSQVWLVPHKQDGKIFFKGDSDAMIVKGLIAVVLSIYNNKSPSEIKAVAVENIFAKLGLKEHLSPSRRNGLLSMTEKIRYYAEIL
ncbi:MAG: SufE family protein [Alphaproteobacteria bacterium]|nr:SufE family protein [Alphaproteobacteria bacterium]